MSENKIGPNLQAGAGFICKRVQKSLNRAQEKVSQGKHSHGLSLSADLNKLLSDLSLFVWSETCWGVASCPDIPDLKCGTTVELLIMTYISLPFQLYLSQSDNLKI